jgi:hypothetical protein
MRKEALLLLFVTGLILINSCGKELSRENLGGPSQGTLQDGGTGDCLPKTVSGTYVAGTALNPATNYIEVQVHVTKSGPYIITSDTLNGISFKTSGVFSDTGLVTVRLLGAGTPQSVGGSTFTITYGSSSCAVTVTTVATLAVFTLSGSPDTCMNYVVSGTYTVGSVLTISNTVTIHVDVTTAGAYSITTSASNGMIFTGSGTLAVGPQTIVLSAAGTTPNLAGVTTVPVIVGSTSCNFKVNVASVSTAATFTINCASAAPSGTYTVNTALTPSNTINLSVNVTAPGTYTISGSINNMTFTGSGSFAAAGNNQSVTLTGTGTPNTAGANVVQLNGGTTPCNVTVNVNPAAAVFTINCTGITVNGNYVQNTALGGTNTITVPVNITTTGNYNAITTTTTYGMTFTAPAGTWSATGANTLTLTGSGTPNASGTTFIPITVGSTTCNVLVLVSAPAANSDYFPRTTNSNWSYEFDNVSSDSLYTYVIPQTFSALGNTYNIFMGTDGTATDTIGYFRRNAADYFRYTDLADYLGVDNIQRVDFSFLKDNQAAGFSWTTTNYVNTVLGNPITFRIKFTIVNANTTVPITTALTGTINYANTIVVEEHYEADLGAGFISLDDQIGYYRDYYSKNIGWIKDEYIDSSGTIASTMNLRRFIVY